MIQVHDGTARSEGDQYDLAVLSRLFGRASGPELPPIDADSALDDHELRAARDAAAAGDWTAARDVMAAAGTDWGLRTKRMFTLSAADSNEWLADWLMKEPDDPAAATLHAATLFNRAADARGSASAKNTSAEQFASFHALAEASAEASGRAIALVDPGDPAAHIQLISAMFADGRVRTPEFQETVDEAKRRDPHNFELHQTVVSLLCEKWYGSHEQMYAAAREVAAAAPEGSSAVMIPYLAHFEYAMREHCWDTRAKPALAAAAKHFKRPDVQRELDALAAKWRAGTPVPGRGMTCRNWLALYYWLAGRRPEARAVFEEIGPYYGGSMGWGYFHRGGAAGFEAARAWAYR